MHGLRLQTSADLNYIANSTSAAKQLRAVGALPTIRSRRPIDRFCPELTFGLPDLSDRFWSTPAAAAILNYCHAEETLKPPAFSDRCHAAYDRRVQRRRPEGAFTARFG